MRGGDETMTSEHEAFERARKRRREQWAATARKIREDREAGIVPESIYVQPDNNPHRQKREPRKPAE